LDLWNRYHAAFLTLEQRGVISRPVIQEDAIHNGHIYYLLVENERRRADLTNVLECSGVEATFHYMPLHRTAAGMRFGRAEGPLAVTDDVAARILRLPLYASMSTSEQDRVITAIYQAFNRRE